MDLLCGIMKNEWYKQLDKKRNMREKEYLPPQQIKRKIAEINDNIFEELMGCEEEWQR